MATSPAQLALSVTHRSEVTADQIDHLGHMNVRFYGVNARAGTTAVVGALGGLGAGNHIVIGDIHTRHLAEQLVGSSLQVRSALIGADDVSLRIYHELVNVETDARAATFIHVVTSADAHGRPQPLPDDVRSRATESTTPVLVATGSSLAASNGDQNGVIPEHGRPRSIDLGVTPVTPDLALLRRHDLHMREPRTITPEECDADGRYPADAHAELLWGGEPRTDREHSFFNEGPNGERLAWAVLESRATILRLPRAGDHVQSFGATRALGIKTSHRMHWVYDVDSGEPLVTFEVVDICFDLDARRAAVIPDSIRESERFESHPELFA